MFKMGSLRRSFFIVLAGARVSLAGSKALFVEYNVLEGKEYLL
jgi:hypothetical protein